MRFTIRDLLWLTVVAAMGIAWGAQTSRQHGRMQALEKLAAVEGIELYPRGWEGRIIAVVSESAMLRHQVHVLKDALESRGHRVIVYDGNVAVDPPAPPFSMPLFGQPANPN